MVDFREDIRTIRIPFEKWSEHYIACEDYWSIAHNSKSRAQYCHDACSFDEPGVDGGPRNNKD